MSAAELPASPEAPPCTWVRTTLGNVVITVSQKVEPADAAASVYVGLEHIGKATGSLLGSGTGAEVTSTKTLFQAGDMLYGKLRPYLNKVALPTFDGICSTDILALRPTSAVLPQFILYRLLSRDFVEYASTRVNGVQHPRVDARTVGAFELFLPSLAEQGRIVAKIEELFSKLDAGVVELKRTQALLKRYRQSLLHAAVTGELTRAWREQQGDQLGDAAQLLAEILAERRRKWATSGKRGKYVEPHGPDVAGLPELPTGWVWASVEQMLAAPIINGLSVKGSDEPPGVPALKLSAMTENGFDFEKIRYLPVEPSAVDDLFLETNDFFVSRGNGTLRLVGRGTVAQEPPFPMIFPDTMMRLRLLSPLTDWVKTVWSSPFVRRQIESGAKTTAGIWKISQPQLAGVSLPLSPLTEQAQIVAEVERRLSILDNMEATVAAELKRAEATRQSILHRAFTGQLVPQDPADEPASALLERIQAEKVKAGAQAIRAGTGKRGRPRLEEKAHPLFSE